MKSTGLLALNYMYLHLDNERFIFCLANAPRKPHIYTLMQLIQVPILFSNR